MNIRNILLITLIIFSLTKITNSMEKEVTFNKKDKVLSLRKNCKKSILKSLIESNSIFSENLLKKISDNHTVKNLIQKKLFNKYDLLFIDLFKECIFKANFSNETATIEFNQNGNRAISICKNGEVNIWDLSNSKNIKLYKFPKNFNKSCKLFISPNGYFVFEVDTEESNKVILWDISNLKNINQLSILEHNSPTISAHFTQDSENIIISTTSGSIKIWNISDKNNISSKEIYSSDEPILVAKIVQNNKKNKKMLLAVKLNSRQTIILNFSDLNEIEEKNPNFEGIKSLHSIKSSVNLLKHNFIITLFSGGLLNNYTTHIISVPVHLNENSKALIKKIKIHNNHTQVTMPSASMHPTQLYALTSLNNSTVIWKFSKNFKIKIIKLKNHNSNKLLSGVTFTSSSFKHLINCDGNTAYIWNVFPRLNFEQMIFIAKANHFIQYGKNWKTLLKNEYFKNIFNSFSKNQQNIIISFFSDKNNCVKKYFIPKTEEKNCAELFNSN